MTAKVTLSPRQQEVVDHLLKGWELHVWVGLRQLVGGELRKGRQVKKLYTGTVGALLRKGVIMQGHDIYILDIVYSHGLRETRRKKRVYSKK